MTKNLKGISLRSALRLMLDELQLKYVVHNGVLLITSPTKAESDEFMPTRAYAVEDLVSAGPRRIGGPGALGGLAHQHRGDEDLGGQRRQGQPIRNHRRQSSPLVVSQSEEVHEQIEGTLEMLRKAGGVKTGAGVQSCRSEGKGRAPEQAARASLLSGTH